MRLNDLFCFIINSHKSHLKTIHPLKYNFVLWEFLEVPLQDCYDFTNAPPMFCYCPLIICFKDVVKHIAECLNLISNPNNVILVQYERIKGIII